MLDNGNGTMQPHGDDEMTNLTIQAGSKVQIDGGMFFNGEPRVAVVYKRLDNKVCFDIGGAWWHVSHLTEVGA